MSTIGTRLAEEADRREISHAEAGELCGVSQATFSRWTNGANLPTSAHWTKIARFLRVPRDQLADDILTEARQADRDGERMTHLEAKVDSLEQKVDQVLSALDRAFPPKRRAAR